MASIKKPASHIDVKLVFWGTVCVPSLTLYEEGIVLYNELSDADFKKLIRNQYNYIKKIAKEGFY